MSAQEFAEWIAYSQVEPWGEQRADLRAALICKILADINAPKGKAAPKLEDFMLKFERKEAQTTDQMIGVAALISSTYEGDT